MALKMEVSLCFLSTLDATRNEYAGLVAVRRDFFIK